VHIYFLIGFRTRLVVLIDWAWSWLTYQRVARVVPEAPRLQAGPGEHPAGQGAPDGERVGTMQGDT
jgi:NADH dehydrogenase